MSKSPQAFKTISEVSEVLDIPAHVLRFWESRFPQLRPMKSSGGRRYYRPEDVDLLRGIRELLYEDGLTIKGVQKIFREQGQKAVLARGRRVEAAAAAMPAGVEPAEAPADLWDDSDLLGQIEPGPAAPVAQTPAPVAKPDDDARRGQRREMIRDAVNRLENVRARILSSLDEDG
ncbi:MAG: MerR family transcriptional regulator [Alphaproteobacteria bacterium]|nr:MAG: MerR family transcriptional regulator [Alphaproteobacteria bacterium]